MSLNFQKYFAGLFLGLLTGLTVYANLPCQNGGCGSDCPCIGQGGGGGAGGGPSGGGAGGGPGGGGGAGGGFGGGFGGGGFGGGGFGFGGFGSAMASVAASNGSVNLHVEFGSPATENLKIHGKFSLYSEKPNPAIYSPQMLQYENPFLNRISQNVVSEQYKDSIGILLPQAEAPKSRMAAVNVAAAGNDTFQGGYSENTVSTSLPSGVTHQVRMIGAERKSMEFNFSEGNSVGTMVGKSAYLGYSMVMTGENGAPVTNNPYYYDLYIGYGAFVRYRVDSGYPVSYHTASGRVLKPSDPSVGLEAIYDQDSNLRQVWSAADGLADIVIVQGGISYEIRFYSPSQVGAKTNGIYSATGTPYMVLRIENPNTNGNNSEVRISRIVGDATYVTLYRYSYASEGWAMYSPGDLAVDSKTTIYDYSGTVRTVSSVVKTLDGQIARKSTNVYQEFGFGERMVASTLDPDGLAMRSSFTYYTDSNDKGRYGKIATRNQANGSWESYSYNDHGWETQIISPWLNSAFNSSAAESQVVLFSYEPHDSRDIIVEEDKRPRTTLVQILGKTVLKEMKAFYFENNAYVEILEKATQPDAVWGSSSNLRTTWKYYPRGSATSPSAGRLQQVVYPDGTSLNYVYEYGNLTQNPSTGLYSFTPGNGNAVREYVTYGTQSSPAGIANRTTRTENLYDIRGNWVYTGAQIYTGSSYETASWIRRSYDEQHRTLSESKSNGELTELTWNCCQKASETLPDGTRYLYAYDAMLRLVAKTKVGIGTQPDQVTTYVYNAAGQVLSETVTGGDLSESSSREYNYAGLLTRQTDKTGLSTTFSYLNAVNAGTNRRGLTVTATLPGGFTLVYAAYCDGQQESLTGTAQTPVYYRYGIKSDGSLWRRELTGGGDSPRRVTATMGMNRLMASVVRSGFGGDVAENFFYNTRNQLTKLTKTGRAPILLSYDELGNRSQIGLDVDGNGVLNPASNDRMMDESNLYVSDNGWWSQLTRKIYAMSGSNATTVLDEERTRLSNFATNVVSETQRTDVNGNTTIESITFDRMAKKRSVAVLYPDSSITALAEKINGLLMSERTQDNLTTNYSYDGLARLIGMTEPRIGTTTVTYHTAPGKAGRLASLTDAAGNATTFDFDAMTGRLAWKKNALGKFTRYAYNDYGLVTRIWGETQYPLEFTYDSYGQQIGMKTYRSGNAWGGVSWPESAPVGDLTTWVYDEASGLVKQKLDAALKSVNYTYTPDGKLLSRTWARGIVTNYNYDAATGQLLKVDYADDTPDITYTYNRLGQLATVNDAAGIHTFSYDAALNRIGEAITGIYDKTLSYSYAATGVKGRYTGFSLDNATNSSYSYDSYGRLNQIAGLGGNFAYNRLTNSGLIENLTRPNGVNTTWAYEAHRNLVAQVANGAVSSFGYVNDALGRRTSMSRSGSAFAVPDVLTYGYNDRSEVISALSNANAAYNYNYNYDPIGNRNTANLTGTAWSYTSNNLNQYTMLQFGSTTENPTYDFDGNMLTREGWTQSWNGENRMFQAIKGNAKLQFAYDYMGRRIEKKVFDGETLSKHTRFVYDGYKLIEELDALTQNATLRKYTWQPESLGLDVPLSVYDAAANATYFYTTDANKNVSDLTDATGAVVAHYEYSPFGVQTKAIGACAEMNPFRFSSEYYDSETNLVYYNYRYYSPTLGRWLSRDPIAEAGGVNLYLFCLNNSNLYIDDLGSEPITILGALAIIGIGKLVADAIEGIADAALKHKLANEIREAIDKEMAKDCPDADAIQSLQKQLIALVGEEAAGIIKAVPNKSTDGWPAAGPSSATPPANGPSPNVTGDRPGYKSVKGYTKSDGTFVHPYHRAAPGQPKIPANYNKQYPKTQPPK